VRGPEFNPQYRQKKNKKTLRVLDQFDRGAQTAESSRDMCKFRTLGFSTKSTGGA
jgi:hypothetical protein